MKKDVFDNMVSSLRTIERMFISGSEPKRIWDGFDPRISQNVNEWKSIQRSLLLMYCQEVGLMKLTKGMYALEVGVEKHRSICRALGLNDWKRMDRLEDVGGNEVDFVVDFVEDGVPDEAKGAFDLVVCSNTLEHTFDIFKGFDAMFEMARDEGLLYFSMPFMLGVHGDEHDYWRMTPACMEKVMEGRASRWVVLNEQLNDKLFGVSCFAVK